MTRRAAIYTRISNDDEGRALGVARQEADCRALAEREGFTVAAVHSDNDISASAASRTRRPGWERLLTGAETGEFDTILAHSLSRLTRRDSERVRLRELHDDHSVGFWLVDGGRVDLASADGQMLFGIRGLVDTAEAARTAERVRRKMLELAQSGRYVGKRPFGWDLIGQGPEQRLVVNAAEAEVLRECVHRTLAGDALWRIVKDLNGRGVTTSTGGPWCTQVLRRTLLRDLNYGYRRHQPMRRGKPAGPAALYRGAWDPIIDRETHERVAAVLTDPRRRSNNRGTECRYLLTNIAVCGRCGGPLVGTAEFTYTLSGGRSRTYPHAYKCPASGCHGVSRRMDDVDGLVTEVLLGVLEREGVRLLGGDSAAAESARARISALEAKLALAADQFADDGLTGDQLARITGKLRPQLEAERARLAGSMPSDALAGFAGGSVRAAWERADVETRRAVLRASGVRVTVEPVGSGRGREFDPDSVRIEWKAGN